MGEGKKPCVICGKDCAGQPRTKDKSGNYYHKACYEKARAQQAARQAEPAREPPPIIDAEPGGFDPFDDIADSPAVETGSGDASDCPSCGSAVQAGSVMCMNCGHNLQSGQAVSTKVGKVKKVKGESGGGGQGMVKLIKNPLVVSVALFVILMMMILIVMATPENKELAVVFALVSYGIGLVINVCVLVVAFREGIGTGFLTLCLPFYILYFVYGVNESSWVKGLFTANLLAQILSFALITGGI